MKLLKQAVWILALTVTLYSCSNAKRSADISNIDLKIEIGRFDRDFGIWTVPIYKMICCVWERNTPNCCLFIWNAL